MTRFFRSSILTVSLTVAAFSPSLLTAQTDSTVTHNGQTFQRPQYPLFHAQVANGKPGQPVCLDNSGSLVAVQCGPVSVGAFGAVGDGVHDDTAALNSAVTMMQATGGTLIFPPGVYLTSTGIVPSTTSANCVNIEGSGPDTTIIRATASMSGVYYRPYGTNQFYCHVSRISFDGNSLAKTAVTKAGQPGSVWSHVNTYGSIPNGLAGQDAQFIVGHYLSDGHPGNDFESGFFSVHVLQQGARAAAPYNFKAEQTTSDSTFQDIVVWGNTTGYTAGVYQDGGGGNTWTHVHCYPSQVGHHQPTCIWDAAGQSHFIGTEVDGMTGPGIVFANGGSVATGTIFVYENDHTDYSKAVGFQQTQVFTTNQVLGANCSGSLSTWTLLKNDTNSQMIDAFGPNGCFYNSTPILTGFQALVVGSLTTTSATSDVVALPGMTTVGHCSLTATNSSAATVTGVYVSAKAAGRITVTHPAAAGLTFDVSCTRY